MPRSKFAFLATAATIVVAACQPTTSPDLVAPQASPSPAASTPAASPSSDPAPSATPALRRVIVTGKVYDDEGTPVDGAQVQVRSEQHPALNQTLEALGGAYVLPNVPERTVLTLTASKDGYTTRQRTFEALILPEGAGYDPNRIDFGGYERGMRHALSRFPEISEVTPANKATGAKSDPLEVKLRFSHAIPADQRGLFESLLKLRFRARGQNYELYPRFSYGDVVARFDWDEDGKGGTFAFDGPIVTQGSEAGVVTVQLDQNVALANWPEDAEGRMLGRGRTSDTVEGSGAAVQNQVAAFLRPAFEDTLPSTRPEALELWGQTHQTTSTFSFAKEVTPLEVVKAEAVPGQGSLPDRFVVTFNRPVRGFPEQALDGSALKPSSYRYVLGRTEKAQDRESFEAADPRNSGSTPDGAAAYYSTTNSRMVILPLATGRLSGYTHFKLYVDPAVKDVAGNSLASDGAVLEGTI